MFNRILVPTDFSPPSDVALEYARVMARRFDASIRLLHVIDDPNLDGFGAEALVPPTPETRTQLLRDAQERLSHQLTAEGLQVCGATSEVVFGKPAQTIIDYAADNGYTLIVMGTHGRSGIAHLLIGSVAELVVRGASCAVMTLHEGAVEALGTAARHRVPVAVTPAV